MSEEQSEQPSITETNESETTNVSPETTEIPANAGKPAGYYPVDPASATPEEVKNRIDYLYRQVKTNNKDLNEYRSIAEQQSKAIEELTSGVVRVVDHLQTKETENSEAELQRNIDAAWAAGDIKAVQESTTKLNRLTVQREVQQALAQQNQKQRPQNQTQQQAYAGERMASSAMEIAQEANFAPQEVTLVQQWQDETDERGQPLRPWTKNLDPEDLDPDYVKVQVVAAKVWKDHPSYTMQQKLTEIDKRMGVRKTAGGQTVLGGSLTTPAKNSNIRLSPDIEKMAVRMKFAGPKASDADHIAKYRKQIEKVRSQGRK